MSKRATPSGLSRTMHAHVDARGRFVAPAAQYASSSWFVSWAIVRMRHDQRMAKVGRRNLCRPCTRSTEQLSSPPSNFAGRCEVYGWRDTIDRSAGDRQRTICDGIRQCDTIGDHEAYIRGRLNVLPPYQMPAVPIVLEPVPEPQHPRIVLTRRRSRSRSR